MWARRADRPTARGTLATYVSSGLDGWAVQSGAAVDILTGRIDAPYSSSWAQLRPEPGQTDMAFSITRLLLHSNAVPAEARDALKTAFESEPEQKEAWLQRALRLLRDATDLDCSDAHELVGLAASEGCA